MRLLMPAVLLLALLAAVPIASAHDPDPVDCARSLVSDAFCEVSAHDCTSTSRCTGADAGVPWKQRYCVDVFCTPWVPYCVSATVWFESYDPTYSDMACSPVFLPS